jgi:hypothetical protein
LAYIRGRTNLIMKMSNFIYIALLVFLPISLFAATLDVTTGPTSGNTIINITKEGSEVFGIPATVTIGGRAAEVTNSGAGVIVIKTPEGVGQNLSVVITWSMGSITASNTFSYLPPNLTNITPDEFLTSGIETATITGSNLGTEAIGLADVLVGGKPATVITQTHNQLTFRVPVGSGTNKNVRIRVGGQLSNILQVDYLPPSIWKVEPKEVTPGPGDTLYITGINFGSGFELPEVRVGNVVCGEIIYAGDDRLYAVMGIGTPANLDVQVMVDGQFSNTFTLQNKKPEIVSVSDVLWNPGGGDNVTIFGKHLGSDLSKISLDLNGKNIPLTSILSNGIMFTTVPGCGQNLPLTLTVNGVKSEVFNISYEQSVLSAIAPTAGSTLGFIPITISGVGIGAGGMLPKVLFGDQMASNVQVVNNNQISCTLPAGVGQVEVKLDLNGITSNSLLFTYSSPQIFGVNPFLNPLSGGEVVIAGLELGNSIDDVVVIADGVELIPTAVSFGAVTVNLPAGFGQGKALQLRVGGILSNTLNYAYVSPSITSINPSTGLPGQVLTIQGSNLGSKAIPSQVTIDGNPAGILTRKNNEIRCIIPAGSGDDKEVVVSIGNTSDNFIGFTYDDPPSVQDQKVEVVGQLRVTDLPFKTSNGVLLGVDAQGNLVRNTSPQISVSITNDTLFIGANQFLIIPGISKANGGN